uniref:Ig-like domain-containing protein n=1 Tax=Esox lucius TaxID=8010 RepID=A0A6Q2XHC8_ESOLU
FSMWTNYFDLILEWSAWMPSKIEALRGLCVVIPCSFTLSPQYESWLTASCKGIWMKRWSQVFDSSLTGTGFNEIPGNLTGNLEHKECTTVLNDLPYLNHYFYFRLECGSSLKFSFSESVRIVTKDDPSQPTLTPATVEVMEGTSVNLICSAAAPCPTLPPTLTWTPTLTGSMQDFPEPQNQVLTSVMNFTVSHVHHGEEITCTALYKQKPGMSEKSSQKSLTVTVFYSPKNTSVSVRPSFSVVQDSSVSLTCSSSANPYVLSYNWYRVIGEQVTQIGAGKSLTLDGKASDSGEYYCEALHALGMEKATVLVVQFACKCEYVHCLLYICLLVVLYLTTGELVKIGVPMFYRS